MSKEAFKVFVLSLALILVIALILSWQSQRIELRLIQMEDEYTTMTDDISKLELELAILKERINLGGKP